MCASVLYAANWCIVAAAKQSPQIDPELHLVQEGSAGFRFIDLVSPYGPLTP